MTGADLAFAGIAGQAELIRAGEVSARELVEEQLRRIERIDPALNAFRTVFAERALIEADQAQARRGLGEERPLLGVPIAIKDDTDVAGEVTARGSSAHGGPAERDAELVRRLRAAGAIVIGKTHVPELEQWPFTESATFGYTRNPWATDRTPGGSSGGSAAAVAAGLVGAASGSDGGGSIRIPAACCGLFGLKPGRGRVPHPPGWHGLSVVGPLARRVADSALFLDVVADRSESGSFADAARTQPGRLRIALSEKPPPTFVARLGAEMRAAAGRVADLLRSLGHEVVERDPDYGPIANNMRVRYLRGIHDDAVAMARPERLERRTRAMVRLGSLVRPALLERVRAGEEQLFARVNSIFDGADLILTPALAEPAVEAGRWEGLGALRTLNGVTAFTPYTPAWNAAGNPAASVPAGLTPDGVPLAVQLVAPAGGEDRLLSLAAQLEAELGWPEQRPPLGDTP
jgi:amidase